MWVDEVRVCAMVFYGCTLREWGFWERKKITVVSYCMEKGGVCRRALMGEDFTIIVARRPTPEIQI